MRLLRGLKWLALGFTILAMLLLASLGACTAYGTKQANKQFPAIGKFQHTRLGKLHYTDQGKGPAVILLHGASSNLREFEESLVPMLVHRYRVINIDRPGYGHSERLATTWPSPAVQAEAIRDLLTALEVKSPVLVGHSLAGAVVMAYALQYPAETRAVVSLAGGTHPWKSGVAWHVALAGQPLLGRLFTSTLVYPTGQLMSGAAIQHVFWPETPPPQYAHETGLSLALRPDAFRASAEDIAGLSAFLEDQSQHYKALRVPVLLIHGTHDRVVPAWNHATRTMKQYPKATIRLLTGAGHGLHHTRTQAIAVTIQDWLQ
jgi:pimeloyl-ACP methyl ester carboxylesterase